MKPRHRPRRSTDKKGAGKLTPKRKVLADRRRTEDREWLREIPTATFDDFAAA